MSELHLGVSYSEIDLIDLGGGDWRFVITPGQQSYVTGVQTSIITLPASATAAAAAARIRTMIKEGR